MDFPVTAMVVENPIRVISLPLDRFEEVAWDAMRGMRLVKFISYAPISGGYRAIDVYEEDEALLSSLAQNPNESSSYALSQH